MSHLSKIFLLAMLVVSLAAQPAFSQEERLGWEPILSFSSDQVLAGLIVSIGLLVFLILFWMILRQVSSSREFAHAERMKAIEGGQLLSPVEPDRSREKYAHNAFWIAFWLGAGVPMAGFGAASSATIQGHIQDIGLVLAIWICVAMVGVASVICATVLMVAARRVVQQGEKTMTEACGHSERRS